MALVTKIQKNTQQKLKNVVFSDFFSNLNLQPVKNDLLKHENEESVKRSIKNILLTNRGERVYNPLFGSDLNKMLFENFTPANDQIVADLIKNAVNNFEPRANIIEILVTSDIDLNSLYVTIIFSVINKSEPITLDLVLNRIR